jgi:hypothetical protein
VDTATIRIAADGDAGATHPSAGRVHSAYEFIKVIETGRELLTVFLPSKIFTPQRKDPHHQRRNWDSDGTSSSVTVLHPA